jgi:hypothetical protein
MNDSTIRLSADTSALTDSLSKIADAELEDARKEINNIERDTMRSMESQFKYI